MKLYTFLLALVVTVSACADTETPPPMLQEGRWTGFQIPEGDPDQRSGVYFRVAYGEGQPTILVGVEGSTSRDARDIEVSSDSLKFVFDKSEADIPVRCSLGLQSNGSYEGLCIDGEGASVYFVMKPPDPSAPLEA